MELLFVRYQKQLYNYFLKCTLDREDSRDLTQNTFIRVLKYRSSFGVDRGFRVWLFQIARNLVKDHYRNRQEERGRFNAQEQLPDPAGVELNQDQVEREERLHKALALLPQEKRELLAMGKFQGLKYEEIARVRGVSVGAIKVQMHRTIAELRRIYFEELKE